MVVNRMKDSLKTNAGHRVIPDAKLFVNNSKNSKISKHNLCSGKSCKSALLARGVLDKDPTIWLDGARLADTCIPPSFPGNAHELPHGIPHP